MFKGISTAIVLVLHDKTFWLKTTSLVCFSSFRQTGRLPPKHGHLIIHTPQLY